MLQLLLAALFIVIPVQSSDLVWSKHVADTDVTLYVKKQEFMPGMSFYSLACELPNGKSVLIARAAIVAGNFIEKSFAAIKQAAEANTIQQDEILELLQYEDIFKDMQQNTAQVAIISDLYVEPAFRNQGMAHLLLEVICAELTNQQTFTTALLVPSPFELNEQGMAQSQRHQESFAGDKNRLIALYSKFGFECHTVGTTVYMVRSF